MQNPFSFDGPARENALVPRPEIDATLMRHLENGQNLLVQGPRRTGKTSSVINFFGKQNCTFVRCDFYGVSSEESAARIIGTAIQKIKGLPDKARKAIGGLAGVQAFGFGINLRPAPEQNTVHAALSMLKPLCGHGKRVVVFMDEIQDLLHLDNHVEIFGQMRAIVQDDLAEVLFIFGGSDQNQLRNLFFNARKAFFKSAGVLDVSGIPAGVFIPWIQDKFAAGGRTIAAEYLAQTYDSLAGIPGDMQWFCFFLWEVSKPGEAIGPSHATDALTEILHTQGQSLGQLWALLPITQRNALLGLIRLGPASTEYTSVRFVRESGLSSGSVALRALNALEGKGVIWKYGNAYRFTNPFFPVWIQQQSFAS